MANKKIIRNAARMIADKFRPNRIILFGSHARGTADEKSDIDFLVICPLKKSRRKMMLEIDSVLLGTGLARDIVILTPEEFETEKYVPGTVARYASKEGKLLYEQK